MHNKSDTILIRIFPWQGPTHSSAEASLMRVPHLSSGVRGGGGQPRENIRMFLYDLFRAHDNVHRDPHTS